MGCSRLWVGAESGSQRILDAMQRRTDAARVPEVVRMLRRHGIEAGMFIMLGYDSEEIPDLEETVAMLKRADPGRVPDDGRLPHQRHALRGDRVRTGSSRSRLGRGSDRERTVAGRHSRRFYHYRHALDGGRGRLPSRAPPDPFAASVWQRRS